jgi:hypothetical protein
VLHPERLGSPMPDPTPDADTVVRLWEALAESFSDYHSKSSDQRKMLAQLIGAVEAAELRRILRALEHAGIPVPDALVQRLIRRAE